MNAQYGIRTAKHRTMIEPVNNPPRGVRTPLLKFTALRLENRNYSIIIPNP